MKKLLLLISVTVITLSSCGKSEEQLKAEKQKKMSDKLNSDINKLKQNLADSTAEYDRKIAIEKAK